MPNPQIYLAGPDVFRAEANSHFFRLKHFASMHGIDAHSPFDGEDDAGDAQNIFTCNLKVIEASEIVVANLVPFRGLCVDDGTAFEIGYAFAKGKKIYGYTPYSTTSTVVLASQFRQFLDIKYPQVEDFNLPCNLMIAQAIYNSGGMIMDSYESCILSISSQLQKQ